MILCAELLPPGHGPGHVGGYRHVHCLGGVGTKLMAAPGPVGEHCTLMCGSVPTVPQLKPHLMT